MRLYRVSYLGVISYASERINRSISFSRPLPARPVPDSHTVHNSTSQSPYRYRLDACLGTNVIDNGQNNLLFIHTTLTPSYLCIVHSVNVHTDRVEQAMIKRCSCRGGCKGYYIRLSSNNLIILKKCIRARQNTQKSCRGIHLLLEETKPPILYHYYKL